MEYTERELEALSMMRRTDFKNITKADVINITSKLGELRPEVAREIVAQFPELAGMIKTSWSEYGALLSKIIGSDDDSVNQFYLAMAKAQDEDAESRRLYYDLAEKICADYSKCLSNPELSSEERMEILAKEGEVLKQVGEKDSEIRMHEEEVVTRVDKKDTEKREYNDDLIKIASAALVLILSVGATALGGTTNVKMPKIRI